MVQTEMSHEQRTIEASGHPYGDPQGWCRDVADPCLNNHGPPVRTRLPYGHEGWMVTRFKDVRFVLSDRRFSHALAAKNDMPRLTPAPSSRASLVSRVDPPEHTQMRRLFNTAFGPAQARGWQPWVKRHADARIDQIIATGPPADLARDLFDPVALNLIGEVMGVPARDRSRLQSWATAHQSTTVSCTDVEQSIGAACAYFDELVRNRHRQPGDDIISEALQIRDGRGYPITDTEVASLATGLFATGFETTTGQLQVSTHALLSHPDQMATLRAHPELMPQAIEELIRYAPILAGPARARCAVEDVEISDVLVQAGELVLPNIAAAGFDPTIIANPYQLDISRQPVPSLIFGFGSYFCQGAQLARTAMSAVLLSLIEHFPHLRVAVPNEQLRWRKSRLRSLEELPVAW